MDGWGALTMLIKRQESDKFRKTQLRVKLKNQKEGYLNANQAKDEFDFPKISSEEMKKLKNQIRKDLRKENVKNTLFLLVIFIIVLSVITYVYLEK